MSKCSIQQLRAVLFILWVLAWPVVVKHTSDVSMLSGGDGWSIVVAWFIYLTIAFSLVSSDKPEEDLSLDAQSEKEDLSLDSNEKSK